MLNVDVTTILFQAINFLILAYLLNRFLFQPTLRRAKERVAEKDRLMAELAQERRDLTLAREKLDVQRQELDDQREDILGQVREEAEVERRNVLRQLQSEAAQVLVEAEADARRLQRQAYDDFRTELVDAVLFASGRVLQQVIPAQANDALIDKVTERIHEMGRTEMDRVEALRRSLAGRELAAEVTTAQELTMEQQGRLARILAALTDQNVDLQLAIDPNLVAGLRVRLGDMIIDNSVASQLNELREQVLSSLQERIKRA